MASSPSSSHSSWSQHREIAEDGSPSPTPPYHTPNPLNTRVLFYQDLCCFFCGISIQMASSPDEDPNGPTNFNTVRVCMACYLDVFLHTGIVEDGRIEEPELQATQSPEHQEAGNHMGTGGNMSTSVHHRFDPPPTPPHSSAGQLSPGAPRRTIRKSPVSNDQSRRNKKKAQRERPRTQELGRFPCRLNCGKFFVRRTDQERHCKTAAFHSPEKPWKCGLCYTKFNREDNYHHHLDSPPKKCPRGKEAWNQQNLCTPPTTPDLSPSPQHFY